MLDHRQLPPLFLCFCSFSPISHPELFPLAPKPSTKRGSGGLTKAIKELSVLDLVALEKVVVQARGRGVAVCLVHQDLKPCVTCR